MTPKYLVEVLREYLLEPTRDNYGYFEALFEEHYPQMKLLDLYQDDDDMVIEYERSDDATT